MEECGEDSLLPDFFFFLLWGFFSSSRLFMISRSRYGISCSFRYFGFELIFFLFCLNILDRELDYRRALCMQLITFAETVSINCKLKYAFH